MYILPSTHSDFFLFPSFPSSEYPLVLPSSVEPSPTVETNELLITMTVIVAGLTLLTLLVIIGVIFYICNFFWRIRKSTKNSSGTLDSTTPNQYLEEEEIKDQIMSSQNIYTELPIHVSCYSIFNYIL